MNNNFRGLSHSWQLLILLLLSFGGILVSSALQVLPLQVPVEVVLIAQDVFAFILPAIILAWLMAKGGWWKRMYLGKAPSAFALAMVVAVALVSIPAMNWVTDWNSSVHLPQSMSGIEQAMRQAEDAAANMTKELLDCDNIPRLIVILMVVGVMAGLSEEMFFRGGILVTLLQRGHYHVMVWTTAIIFSAIHFQFFGFVPRMLLGAWFGYLMVWSRSLWVPVIAHTLNNSMAVVCSYMGHAGVNHMDAVDRIGVDSPWLALASAGATIALIVVAKQFFSKKIVENRQ
ncbi:MAG: CPBP family intramembrane metalloprotease [Bacteroidales bacterium]|nr:CPBP family intramembrane metalloprotease [Candidatus Sodaliphilus aphodohippi]